MRELVDAENATVARQVISYAPAVVLTVLGVALAATTALWLWWGLGIVCGMTALVLANHWANHDALHRNGDG